MTQETADGKGLCCRHMPAQTWEAMRTWSAVKQAIGQFCPFLAGKMATWPRPGLPGLHRLDKIVSSSTVDPKFPRANFSPSVVSVLVHCAEKGPRASVPHWEKWLHCVVMPAEVMTWWCVCCPCPTPAERVTVPCGPLPRWRQLPFQHTQGRQTPPSCVLSPRALLLDRESPRDRDPGSACLPRAQLSTRTQFRLQPCQN